MKSFLIAFLLCLSAAAQVSTITGGSSIAGETTISAGAPAAPVCTILTTSLPSVIQGGSYAQTLSSQNCTSPHWIVLSGSLPPSFSLNASTGAITSSGATTVGAYPFTVEISNASNTPTQALSISVTCPPLQIISPPLMTNGQQNFPYSARILSQGGVSPLTWSQPSGTAPSGVTIAPSTGLVSGTPLNAGTFAPVYKVVDSCPVPQNAQQTFSLTIIANPPLLLTNTSPLATGVVGTALTIPLTATGGVLPYSFSNPGGGLAPGISLSGATLTGTPTTSGTYSAIGLRVTDSVSSTNAGASPYTQVITCPAMSITSNATWPVATKNSAYSFSLTALGGVGTRAWAISGQPSGLTVNAGTGVVSGPPTASGTFSISVSVTDSCLPTPTTANQTASLTVNNNTGSLLLTVPTPLPAGVVGTAVTIPLTATGGTTPYTYSNPTSNLPTGLSISGATIIGTPTTSGSYTGITLRVTDNVAATNDGSSPYSMTVTCPTLSVTSSASWPNATQNQPYSLGLTASGGVGARTWSVTGLPTGLSVAPSTGVVSGTPTVFGAFTPAVSVHDSCLATPTTATQSATLTVVSAPGLMLTNSTPLASCTVGVPCTVPLTATGGTPPYTFSNPSNNLAPGLAISGATITGTPTQAIGPGGGGALTWAPLTITPTDPRMIAFDSSNNWYIADRHNGIYMCANPCTNSSTWTQQNSGLSNLSAWTVNYDATHNQLLTAPIPSSTNTYFRSALPCCSWVAMTNTVGANGFTPPFGGGGVASNGNVIIGGLNGSAGTCGSMYSTDSGATMHSASCTVNFGSPPGGQYGGPYINPSDNSTWIGTEQYGVFRSTDGGVTYIEASLPDSTIDPSGDHWGNAQALTSTATGTMFMGGQYGVWKQSGSGPVWTWNQVLNTSGTVTTQTLGRDASGNLYWGHTAIATGTWSPTVWQSVDNGSTWQAYNTGTISAGLNAIQFIVNPNDNALYAIIHNPTAETGQIYRLQSSGITLQVTDNVGATDQGASPYTQIINPASNADNIDCSASNVWIGPTTDGPANAPLACVNTARANSPSTPGSVVNVAVGSCASLQTAINAATAGQTIILTALNGSIKDVFSGCQISPAAAGNATHWITVETDQVANLPTEGNRVSPAFVGITSLPGRPSYSQPTTPGIYMPQIVCNAQCINVQATAAYWRFIGLEVTTTSGVNTTQAVILNPGAQHIIFDQMVVHGGNSATGQDRDNVQAAVRFTANPYSGIVDSYLYDTHCIANGTCGDSQGVFLGGSDCATDGPIKVVNNFIESAGENIFSGGGGCGAGTQAATDTEIRHNHLFKPLFWKVNDPSYFGTQFIVKNCMEFKNSIRAWIQGNLFDQTWGFQSDQHGICVLFDSRNQNISYSGTATSNGAGALTWVSGTQFMSNIVASNCAVSGHCLVTYNNLNYTASTFGSSTSVTVSPAPPASGAAAFTACEPGLNPNGNVTDMIFIDNYITHAADGIQISNPLSDCNDVSLGGVRFSVHNNAGDDLDGPRWVINPTTGGCCVWGNGLQIQNFEANNLDYISIWHNTFLSTVSTSTSLNGGGEFGTGQQAITGSLIRHVRIYDNIATGGWSTGTAACGSGTSAQFYWNCWTPVAQKCWDNNFLATSTYPTSGTGSYSRQNTPYPSTSDNGYCPYTAKGNTLVTNFTTYQFVNLNGGIGGDYHLGSGSPYKNLASDGTDPGADITRLNLQLAGVP